MIQQYWILAHTERPIDDTGTSYCHGLNSQSGTDAVDCTRFGLGTMNPETGEWFERTYCGPIDGREDIE